MKSLFVLGILCLGGASSQKVCMEPWNTLEHTFNAANVAQRSVKNGTNTVPRSIIVPKNATCINKVGSATYHGIRQQVKGDVSNNLVGLYDKNGYIAGIQVRYNKSALYDGWNNTFRYDRVPMFQIEETEQVTYFVLTAYFVDPSIICSKGRTLAEFRSTNSTGNTLLFQNGPTPSSVLVAPRLHPQALHAGYSDNKCFVGMGLHTFYNVESYQGHNCNEIVPVFLLYNTRDVGCLVGFGFAIAGRAVSPLLEHPPAVAVRSIIGESQMPQCLNDLAGKSLVTTVHVFFTRRSIGCGGTLGAETTGTPVGK